MTGSLYLPNVTIYLRRTLLTLGEGFPESGQMVCAWKGEPEMAKTSICTISCKRLTTKFLIKHTLEREQLPWCFLESYAWIFYNESEQISKGGGVR